MQSYTFCLAACFALSALAAFGGMSGSPFKSLQSQRTPKSVANSQFPISLSDILEIKLQSNAPGGNVSHLMDDLL